MIYLTFCFYEGVINGTKEITELSQLEEKYVY